MRVSAIIAAGLYLLFFLCCSVHAQDRTKYTINDHWKFIQKDLPNGTTAQPDSSWKTINFPHTWNIDDAFDDETGYYRGPAWYQKELSISSDLKNKRLFLHFEGANQVADVYLNGEKIAHHIGGYTAFNADLTNSARFDTTNTLAVRLDNSHSPNVPPLDADFTFFGGIYRDVWLTATNPVHLSFDDHASSGVYISTPSVSKQKATVAIRGSIVNESREQTQIRMENAILDADGTIVKKIDSSIKLQPSQNKPFEQKSISISQPKLWSPQHPNLYTVRTTLYRQGRLIDRVTNPLGFRWYRFDPEEGFFLNGHHLKLLGACRHQDFPNRGNAVPNDLHVQDMKRIKEMGANFVRLAHYPQDPAVLSAADRLGLIIWEEIPIVNYITSSKAFEQNAKTMLTEMISQHFNHPAVMIWGYMNEILLQDKADKYPSGSYHRDVLELAKSLDNIVHRLDPGRVTAMAMHFSDIYNTSGLADVPDVVGWNLYHGWYYGTFSDFGSFLDNQHQRFPDRPIIISEYGTGSDSRIHTRHPQTFDFSVEYQQNYHESYLDQIEERPFIAGSSIWIINDFASEGRQDSRPHINQKGIIRFNRTPKDIYYFYKARFSDKPVVHIASTEWTDRYLLSTDTTSLIKVYSNLSKVELFRDGQSLGTKNVGNDGIVQWQIPVKSGQQELTATASDSNQQSEDHLRLNTHLVPALFKQNTSFTEIAVNIGGHAQYIPEHASGWIADRMYQKGGWGAVGGNQKLTHHNILNSSDEPLYQFYREGINAYHFDVPNGSYEVELFFAEPEFHEPGKRVFSVFLNGQTLFDHLDLAKQYGAWWPVSRKVQINVSDDKGIEITFKAFNGEPILNGIRLQKE